MKLYHMIRHIDETGNSGTGIVGEVCVFNDGTAVLHWDKQTNALNVSSTVIYANLEDLITVHGHGGKTTVEPLTDKDQEKMLEEYKREVVEDFVNLFWSSDKKVFDKNRFK